MRLCPLHVVSTVALLASILAGCGNGESSTHSPTTDPPTSDTGLLRDLHPGDAGMSADPRVLFQSGFESGLKDWGWHTAGADRIAVDSVSGAAHAGKSFLRARVTRAHLTAEQ